MRVGAWLLWYLIAIAVLALLFRIHEAGGDVPLWLAIIWAGACGACHTGLEQALEHRRKGGGNANR